MRVALVVCLLLVAAWASAQVPWAPAPDVYKFFPDGAIEAHDGGGSTADSYLLTSRDYRDFVLEFTAQRLTEPGEKPRSIVVWAVDTADKANRKAFFMELSALKLGQKAAVRLVVSGDQAKLFLDGKLVSNTPVLYGTPPVAGKVGFLHYFNYGYRYENVRLTEISATALPAPTQLKGTLSPGGVLRLTWQMAEPFGDLVSYRVYRAAGKTVEPTAANLVGETTTCDFSDATLRSNVAYAYVVRAVAGGEEGPAARPTVVRTGRLKVPGLAEGLKAIQRLDGAVRARWQLPADSRQDGLVVYRGRTQAEALGADAETVAARLPAGATTYLVPAGAGQFVAVALRDPDGTATRRAVVAVAPHAPPVQPGQAYPVTHPYLLYDSAEIARARQLATAEEWARKLIAGRRSSADSYTAKPYPVPTDIVDPPYATSGRLQDVALTYQLTGDEKYAKWVRDALVGYAELYAKLPVRGGRVKLSKTISGLYEALWFVNVVCAYDLIYESPALSAQDRERFENDLVRPGAELFRVRDYASRTDLRPADLHYKCYNFQAWFDSAVGLAGLLLKDADLVEHALDGPYGFKHLLAHDVQDDGLFWERSLGYHGFVMSALFPLLRAAEHCNLNLWAVAVPDDYNTDREPLANYCVGDGDNGPKSLRLLLDGPLYCTFPDLTWPVVADSSAGPLTPQPWHRVGWQHYRDPRYAWLLNRQVKPAAPAVWTGPADAGAQVRLAYDDQALYVSAQITDQVVRNSHADPNEAWAGDALWLGLKWTGAPGGPYDFLYGLTPGDGTAVAPLPVLFLRYGQPVNARSTARLGMQRTADGYTLEAAIPWSELRPQAGDKGPALTPRPGAKLAADFVLYDSDEPTGATSKEKMVAWASTTDRYDSTQGGTVVFGPLAPLWARVINAPQAAGLVVDGKLEDWGSLAARAAVIGPGAAVMYDTAAPDGPALDDLFWDRVPAEGARFDLTGNAFANNGVLEAGSSLYPSTGFALLRNHLDDKGLGAADATCVNVTYGPYGGGHGHPDKLSLALWSHGRHLVPDFGSCPYETPEKGQWTAQTISHNTVTVDQASQYPNDHQQANWPCDAATKQARGFLDFFHGDPLLKAAVTRDESTYAGVVQRRAVALLGNLVFDFFTLRSAESHTYDYALHVAAPLAQASVALTPLADPLGDRYGYQHIHRAQGAAETAEVLQTTWRDDKGGLRVTLAGGVPTQLLVAEGMTNDKDKRMPLVILRRTAATTTYGVVLQPLTSGAEPATWTWQRSGNCLAASDGRGGFVACAPEPDKSAQTAGVSFTGALAAGLTAGDQAGYSLVGGTALEVGELRLTADKPVSVYVRYRDGQPRELVTGYASRATVKVRWQGREQTLAAQPRQTYRLGQ